MKNIHRKLREFRQQSREAQAQGGPATWRQLRDIARLMRGEARLGPGDYYTYRLFDPELTLAARAEFVGWRLEARLDRLNERSWACLGLDKVLTTELLAAQGIRCTETRAIYLPGRERMLQTARPLKDLPALHAWLRDPANYPFFGKPAASGFGRGAYFAERYDAATDSLCLRSGERLAVQAFAASLFDHEKLGYLLQTPVAPDARLVPLIGGLVTSLRVMVLLDDTEGPLIHRAFWKLPTGKNMNDNFNDGVTGNLAAGLDLSDGRVTRVVSGSGVRRRELQRHPDTGADLLGLSVPDWPEVCAFVERAALVFPKLRFQQWDIALADGGPLALELNLFGTGGGELSQIIEKRGLMDPTMRRFLARHQGA
ncbi:MAG: hypothetical protein GXC94_07975 [Comamonadaceae bacterium]|nr:hypothetical protein [Comamonadaceae bacterium]